MIIIDTNVLLAFLLTDGITRRIIADNHDVFMSPEHCFEELWEHRFRWNKKKLQDRELLEIVDDVKRLFVMPVFQEVYDPYITAAEKLTDDIDDAPVIALALSIDNEGIWTHNIKHFRQKKFGERIRVLSTQDVLELYPLKE
ncbi:MAG: PIN domain-containing protein [Euryarchaeota archaeon]|nr:PIN domain-containing protein [Euryarchaeota archaeon]MBU4222285.1 PIN domain-containing protein [Euryarchaeota archaeon]MBU4339914.1 PIN domain-containing protein [Euryarchaeota archaeon]MCG2735382.1 PIN domain-containing protein [Candidatus Methanoperedenaceae archaeon]